MIEKSEINIKDFISMQLIKLFLQRNLNNLFIA